MSTIKNSINSFFKKPVEKNQLEVLEKLLSKSRFTEFGQHYDFDKILRADNIADAFREKVPLFDYNQIYNNWWHKGLEGASDVCWPGKIEYYALSSGTSEAASKYIPITKELLQGNQSVMVKQLLSLRRYKNISFKSVPKTWLAFSGSTDLQKGNGYYAGDLSGITSKKVPIWFQLFYKPGKKISKEKDWNKKINEIVEQAPNWDVGFILGVPSWIQMCLELIIERYQLKNIHEIWPNLGFYVHGGVNFDAYRKGFDKLFGKPVTYIETYLASEGYIAYQNRQHSNGGMKMVTDKHLFFEFIPFNDKNFDADGNIIDNPETLLIHETEEQKEYALVMSTAAGAWRYLIGDIIKFSDRSRCEIVITGRTKHFLSLVGEHLSVDNMNKAVNLVSEELNIDIPEFTVCGIPHEGFFAHQWYIAVNEEVDENKIAGLIDEKLKLLNDDYAVERKSTLKQVNVKALKERVFVEFMQQRNKIGAQSKFPRVLKGKNLEEWQAFLKNNYT